MRTPHTYQNLRATMVQAQVAPLMDRDASVSFHQLRLNTAAHTITAMKRASPRGTAIKLPQRPLRQHGADRSI